jgi:hypothetical protein
VSFSKTLVSCKGRRSITKCKSMRHQQLLSITVDTVQLIRWLSKRSRAVNGSPFTVMLGRGSVQHLYAVPMQHHQSQLFVRSHSSHLLLTYEACSRRSATAVAVFEVQASVGLRGHLRACHIQQHCSELKAQLLLYVIVKAQHSACYTVPVTD